MLRNIDCVTFAEDVLRSGIRYGHRTQCTRFVSARLSACFEGWFFEVYAHIETVVTIWVVTFLGVS